MYRKIKKNSNIQTIIAMMATLIFVAMGMMAIGPRANYDSRLLYGFLVFGNMMVVGPMVFFGTIFMFFASPGEMAAEMARQAWQLKYGTIRRSIISIESDFRRLENNKRNIQIRFPSAESVFQHLPIIIGDAKSAYTDLTDKPDEVLLDEFMAYLDAFDKAFRGTVKALTGELRDSTAIETFLEALANDYVLGFKSIADKADAKEVADVRFAIKYLQNLLRASGRSNSQ